MRSDTVNECGPTSEIALGWPPAPEGLRVIRRDSGVTVSWVPGPGLATAPEHLRATGYQVWRAENRPGNVTRVFYVSATQGDAATGRISVADRPGGTAQRILYYRVVALQGRTPGPSTDWVPEVFQMVLSAVPEVSITLQPIQGPGRPGLTRDSHKYACNQPTYVEKRWMIAPPNVLSWEVVNPEDLVKVPSRAQIWPAANNPPGFFLAGGLPGRDTAQLLPILSLLQRQNMCANTLVKAAGAAGAGPGRHGGGFPLWPGSLRRRGRGLLP